MRKITKRTAAIAAAAVLGVGAAGAAWAWTLSGTGNASASAATVQNLVVSEEAATTALYPTGKSGVSFKVENKNAFPVILTTLEIGAVTSPENGCGPQVTQVGTGALAIPNSVTVAPNTTSGLVTVADALVMKADAPQKCAGKTFAIAITVNGSTPSS